MAINNDHSPALTPQPNTLGGDQPIDSNNDIQQVAQSPMLVPEQEYSDSTPSSTPTTTTNTSEDLINLMGEQPEETTDFNTAAPNTISANTNNNPSINLLDLDDDDNVRPLSTPQYQQQVEQQQQQQESPRLDSNDITSSGSFMADLNEERADKGKEEKRYRITVMDETGKPYEVISSIILLNL